MDPDQTELISQPDGGLGLALIIQEDARKPFGRRDQSRIGILSPLAQNSPDAGRGMHLGAGLLENNPWILFRKNRGGKATQKRDGQEQDETVLFQRHLSPVGVPSLGLGHELFLLIQRNDEVGDPVIGLGQLSSKPRRLLLVGLSGRQLLLKFSLLGFG